VAEKTQQRRRWRHSSSSSSSSSRKRKMSLQNSYVKLASTEREMRLLDWTPLAFANAAENVTNT